MHEKIGYDLKSLASHLTYPFFVSISLLIYIFAKLAAEPPNLCRKKWDSIIKVHRTEILNSLGVIMFRCDAPLIDLQGHDYKY